jgi:hypothetical protein
MQQQKKTQAVVNRNPCRYFYACPTFNFKTISFDGQRAEVSKNEKKVGASKRGAPTCIYFWLYRRNAMH